MRNTTKLAVMALGTLSLSLPMHAASGCSGDHGGGSYHAMAGDKSNTTQLQASRAVNGKVNAVEINVGAGQLQVQSAPSGSPLQLKVSSPGADRNLSDYLRDFDVANGTARVSVCVPGNYHASVTLLVPSPGNGKSEVNLGAGNLTLEVGALPAGERQINDGAGNATLLLNGAHEYATLQVNVGMGHFEDQRPGGSSANMVVSRELKGTGRGEIEVNVGAGSLVLKGGPQ